MNIIDFLILLFISILMYKFIITSTKEHTPKKVDEIRINTVKIKDDNDTFGNKLHKKDKIESKAYVARKSIDLNSHVVYL